MIGVQTDIFRFDQQFLPNVKSQLVVCNLVKESPLAVLQAYQPNFFTNQNNLNGKTITGITAIGYMTQDASQLQLGTPVRTASFPLFVLTIIDWAGNVRLNMMPLSVLQEPIGGTRPFTKRFSIHDVNWSASYVMVTQNIGKVFTGDTVLFNVQFQ